MKLHFRARNFTLTLCLCLGFAFATAQTGLVVTMENGLTYEILKEGEGTNGVQDYDVVILREWVRDDKGNLLFSSDEAGNHVEFQIGKEQAIEGIDLGVRGMKIGERRRIVVPPSLSERKTYPEGISPNMTLHYEVEVVDILR